MRRIFPWGEVELGCEEWLGFDHGRLTCSLHTERGQWNQRLCIGDSKASRSNSPTGDRKLDLVLRG
jgi:hypothetical protein